MTWAMKYLKHKYSAVKVESDGIVFDSKLEERYYQQLKIRKRIGEVVLFLMQVPFRLPGGVKYVVDFVEFRTDGSVHFIDTKGMITQECKNKIKQVEAEYAPVKIEIIAKEMV